MTWKVRNLADGWIKLHRKLIDSAVFGNEKLLKIWVWCLIKATHQSVDILVGNQLVSLQAGQFVFGRNKAAVELNISESMVYKYMKMLESMKMISIKSNNKFSVVTIEKWEFYQGYDADMEQQIIQQRNNKGTTEEQQRNTNKNVKKYKNAKNEKNNIEYSSDPALNQAILDFITFRKSIKKPMTDKAIDLMISKLNKITDSIPEQIEILNQSILNGWQGIFPLKGGGNDAGKNKQDRHKQGSAKEPELGIYL